MQNYTDCIYIYIYVNAISMLLHAYIILYIRIHIHLDWMEWKLNCMEWQQHLFYWNLFNASSRFLYRQRPTRKKLFERTSRIWCRAKVESWEKRFGSCIWACQTGPWLERQCWVDFASTPQNTWWYWDCGSDFWRSCWYLLDHPQMCTCPHLNAQIQPTLLQIPTHVIKT